MNNVYWVNWYAGWGWLLWFGFMVLLFSSAGNWGHTYRVHRFYGRPEQGQALAILSQRYARGEVTHDEYVRMKSAIVGEPTLQS